MEPTVLLESRNDLHVKRRDAYPYLLIALLGLVIVYALPLSRVSVPGDFFNSYPFITDDGFDWILEGAALHDRLAGKHVPPLHLLRAPGFVLVTALDSAVDGRGLVVILAQGTAFFVTGLLLLSLARRLGVSPLLAGATLAVAMLTPLNYFRLFVLADPLAVALLCGSAVSLLRYFEAPSARSIGTAAGLAVIGALTQTYAAIPFLVGSALDVALRARRRQSIKLPAAALILAGLALAGLKLLWKASMPHLFELSTFGVLGASFAMWDFYLHVWTFAFAPILPALVTGIYCWLRRGRPREVQVAFATLSVLAFAILSFFYQWPETRFTFIYHPLVIVLVLLLLAPTSSADEETTTFRSRRAGDPPLGAIAAAGVVASALLVVAQLGVTPSSYWSTRLDTLEWKPERSWLAIAWAGQPTNRLGLGAPGPDSVAGVSEIPAGLGPYPRMIYRDYVLLRGRPASRIARPGEVPALQWNQHRWQPADRLPGGRIDSMLPTSSGIQIVGWAADLELGVPERVYFYVDRKLVAAGFCGVPRPDVVSAFGLRRGVRPGFSLVLATGDDVDSGQIQAVAWYRDGSSHLLTPMPAAAVGTDENRPQSQGRQ